MAALSNDIYIGSASDPIYHYDNARLVLGGAKGTFSVDLVGNELPIDTFTVVVRYDPLGSDAIVYGVKSDTDPWDGEYLAYQTAQTATESAALYVLSQTSPSDYLTDIPFGTAVYWYISSAFFAKGYLKSVERVSKIAWKLTCVSGIGLLDARMHKGGYYEGTTVGTLVTSIVGDVFPYSIVNDVKNIQIYGHLPYDTCRNNLHRILFATGAVMLKGTESSDYIIRYLANTIYTIPPSRIALGGSVLTQLPVNKAEVTEHGFYSTAGDEVVTLYDNTGGTTADNQLVVFDQAPVHDLTRTGTLTLVESNVNYAIVSGTGTLTGKLYQHTTQIIEMVDNPDNLPERVVRVEDNEIISAVNSRNVARRILNYYKSTKTVKAKMMLNDEKCGSYIQSNDAFGDLTAGYMHKMEIVPTTVKGANVEIVDGYVADASGNNYTHREILTGSGTWKVPSGVTEIRIILVGGGDGGQGGYDGKPGKAGVRYTPGGTNLPMDIEFTEMGNTSLLPYDYSQGRRMTPEEYIDAYNKDPGEKLYYVSSQPFSSGGKYGEGGSQGKIKVYDKTVIAGETISFASGIGGVGGDSNGGDGGVGTDTTASSASIGSLTSADGDDNGYYDPLSHTTYGKAGKHGYSGGRGGTSGGEGDAYSGKYSGCDGGDGVSGGSSNGYFGGAGGIGTGYDGEHYPAITSHGTDSGLSDFIFKANGAGGGGAAYGNDGEPGGTYSITENWVDDPYLGQEFYGFIISNALGGAGANAIAPQKASYGNGGRGGNGGGGGGNASGVWCDHAYVTYYGQGLAGGQPINAAGNTGAPGGLGSKGGDGGDGCVIIYY